MLWRTTLARSASKSVAGRRFSFLFVFYMLFFFSLFPFFPDVSFIMFFLQAYGVLAKMSG